MIEENDKLYRVLTVGGSLEAEKYKKRRESLEINSFSDMVDRVAQDSGFIDYQDQYTDEMKYEEDLPAQWTNNKGKIQPYLPMNTDSFIVAEADLEMLLDYHDEESLDTLDNREHAGFYGYRVDFVPLESVKVVTPPTRKDEVNSKLDRADVESPDIDDWNALEYSESVDMILQTLS